jgi:hypothetical protein
MAKPTPSSAGSAGSTFRHFAAQLYCSGAEEQRCPDGRQAGVCNWFRSGSQLIPIVDADVNRSWSENSRRFSSDRWDPVRAGASGFRYFDRDAAASCVRGKRIHLAGDSTTRDTFYEFAAAAGHSMFADPKQGVWPPGAYEPRSPMSSAGRDIHGECLGNFDRKKFCVRDERYAEAGGEERSAAETRLSFQFLMRSNSSWEVSQAAGMLADRRIDAAFVQCPIYEWFKPDAYNYSKSKEERARIVDVDELAVGPKHWAGMGTSCAQYIDTVIRPNASRLFMLGPTPLPMWTRLHGSEQVEARVFEALHKGLGVRCHRHMDHSWGITSRSGVTPIDRYAIVGGRRRDAIHPFFNAQFAIVQLMLNHLCPPPHERVAKGAARE